jgi:hypothetical protein
VYPACEGRGGILFSIYLSFSIKCNRKTKDASIGMLHDAIWERNVDARLANKKRGRKIVSN